MYLFMIVTTQVFNAPLILLIGGSFILRGPVRPGPSETTYCRNFLLFHLIHHQFRGNFILRGRFGPVCQRLPIVETSSSFFLIQLFLILPLLGLKPRTHSFLVHLLLIGGSFILRGRFGPVCQRRPTVETSTSSSL